MKQQPAASLSQHLMSLSSIVPVFVDISIFVSNVNDISPVLNPVTGRENKLYCKDLHLQWNQRCTAVGISSFWGKFSLYNLMLCALICQLGMKLHNFNTYTGTSLLPTWIRRRLCTSRWHPQRTTSSNREKSRVNYWTTVMCREKGKSNPRQPLTSTDIITINKPCRYSIVVLMLCKVSHCAGPILAKLGKIHWWSVSLSDILCKAIQPTLVRTRF